MKYLLITALVAVAAVVFVILASKKKGHYIPELLYNLVTEAEARYGAGTGEIKFAWVFEKAYEKLPSAFKAFLSYDRLKAMIEEALALAKDRWGR